MTNKRTLIAIPHNSRVSVSVRKELFLLKLEGIEVAFPKIIEEVCWLVSVAGETSISCLRRYMTETKNGTTTRAYSETMYTGKPVIVAVGDGRFNVSFDSPRTEKLGNQEIVAKPGHCWKTMAGLSIVAKGYTIPPRTRQNSGLEAPLFVLRQLFQLGRPGKCALPSDEPMVMFPPTESDQGYKLRLIMAVNSERAPTQRGNTVYWHFDPAKLCNSEQSLVQLESSIHVQSSAINSNSRHIVGWSTNAGFLAGKQAA